MKKLFLLIPALILTGMFFYGCQEEAEIISPDSNSRLHLINTSVVWASEVVDYCQGLAKTGASIPVGRSNPEMAKTLEAGDLVAGQIAVGTFFSLGMLPKTDCEEKYIVLAFDNYYSNTDLVIYEVTNGTYPKEEAEVSISVDGIDWYYLGVANNITRSTDNPNLSESRFQTDGLCFKYVKVVDISDPSLFSNDIGSDGFDLTAVGLTASELCDPCQYETAWAAGERYVTKGNWATYTPFVANTTVTLFGGQTIDIGTVHFSDCVDGKVTITINLTNGWELQDVDESVKVQGYFSIPSGKPSPGLFNSYKGDLLEFEVDCYSYYGIHLDVRWCPPPPPPPCDPTVGNIYGMERLTGDVYKINVITGVAELSFSSVAPPATSISPNGLAYDGINKRMYYCDYRTGSSPRPLYFWDYNTSAEIQAGTLPVENAAADFYNGKYYYISSYPGTDDLYEVTFNSNGTILNNIKLADIANNAHGWTFDGDIAIKDGILYGWGDCTTHGFEFFTYNLSSGDFSLYNPSFQNSLQLAFGSNGDLYGHRSATPGNFYLINITNGSVGAPIAITPGKLFTDCASGYTCP